MLLQSDSRTPTGNSNSGDFSALLLKTDIITLEANSMLRKFDTDRYSIPIVCYNLPDVLCKSRVAISVTLDSPQISCVTLDGAQISHMVRDGHQTVIRDLLFYNRVTLDIPLTFPQVYV